MLRESQAPVGHQNLPVRAQVHRRQVPQGKRRQKPRVPYPSRRSAWRMVARNTACLFASISARTPRLGGRRHPAPREGQPDFVPIKDISQKEMLWRACWIASSIAGRPHLR